MYIHNKMSNFITLADNSKCIYLRTYLDIDMFLVKNAFSGLYMNVNIKYVQKCTIFGFKGIIKIEEEEHPM